MEKWDLYDINRKPLNRTMTRDNPDNMNPDEYHIIVEVWTVNSEGRILLTLRDKAKETYPGFWENTGGSVLAGETSDAGAARELREETGLDVNPKELSLLYMRREKNAFLDTYVLRRDFDMAKITLQPGETCDRKLVTLRELEAMIAGGLIARPIVERLNDYRNVFERIVKQATTTIA